MKFSALPLFGLLVLLATGCGIDGSPSGPDKPPEPPPLFPAAVNERIQLLRSCCKNPFNEGPPEFGLGHFYQSVWSPGEVFTIHELRRLDVQQRGFGRVDVTGEHFYNIDSTGMGPASYITKSPAKHLLYVIIGNTQNQSPGALRVLNLDTPDKFPTLLRDSTYHISSIRIRQRPDGSLLKVYYSYGNPDTDLQAGYYRLKPNGPPDELLLAHANPNGPRETINGFDLSPDGATLLFPIHYAFVPGHAYGGPPPKLATLNLASGRIDTMPIHFGFQQFLWARYHPDGDSLVVSNYPRNILGFTSVDGDSMYTVDLADYNRRPLDTRTWKWYYTADVFPDWSPDGRYLIYGSAEVFPSNLSIGWYSVYIMDMNKE